jgi:hypothetical protein
MRVIKFMSMKWAENLAGMRGEEKSVQFFGET